MESAETHAVGRGKSPSRKSLSYPSPHNAAEVSLVPWRGNRMAKNEKSSSKVGTLASKVTVGRSQADTEAGKVPCCVGAHAEAGQKEGQVVKRVRDFSLCCEGTAIRSTA